MVSIVHLAQTAPMESVEMTEIIEKRGLAACDLSQQADPKIGIRVKTEDVEERLVELKYGTSVTSVLEIVAAESGYRLEELVLLREGQDSVLTSDIVVDANYPHKLCHHVHYADEVSITVYYQADRDCRDFKRFEAVKDVLAWAIKAFPIDATLATELVLVRHGQKDELPEREHVGHLAGKDCELALDLVRGTIANGRSS